MKIVRGGRPEDLPHEKSPCANLYYVSHLEELDAQYILEFANLPDNVTCDFLVGVDNGHGIPERL
jgi:hypothetical protein